MSGGTSPQGDGDPGDDELPNPQELLEQMMGFAQSKMQTQTFVDFANLALRVKEDYRRRRDRVVTDATWDSLPSELTDAQAIDKSFELMDLVVLRWRAKQATHKHPPEIGPTDVTEEDGA